ncbi:hypothetical protein PG996_015120 [Apiospora saccharicola]|uniref:Stc1 domain-containing protein n=1 Tax=Apiospora saccharicola TaxID=335842 RepID=A0ABR1TK75_9PEZI
MCRITKCQVCQIEHAEQLHTPACSKPHVVFRQCQACKDRLGDLKVDPKDSSSARAAERPLPAKRPDANAEDQRKRQGADLFRALVSGRVSRRVTEKANDQKREQVGAAALAMLSQQEQKQPQPPFSDAAYGSKDLMLDDAEDNAAMQQYLHDEPDEVRHYETIMQLDDPDLLQRCIDMLESPGREAKREAAFKPVNNAFGEGTSTLPFNVPQYVAGDDRDKFLEPFPAQDPGANNKKLTLAEIVALLPSPSPERRPTFDFSKPAPAPDTSGLIDLGDSDDGDLKRFIGIGNDDDDDDYCIE